MDAAQYAAIKTARAAWCTNMEAELQRFDALLCPTVAVVAPPLQPLLTDDVQFFKTNALMLRNTSVFNALDGCAISLPAQRSGLPVGLMLGHGNMKDGRVLSAARAVEKVLKKARARV